MVFGDKVKSFFMLSLNIIYLTLVFLLYYINLTSILVLLKCFLIPDATSWMACYNTHDVVEGSNSRVER